jgi:uncharacterized protein (DUF1330 family)
VLLCVLLWARDGEEVTLVEYEDRVLALLPEHGARVQQRVRSDGADGAPLEVHLLEFPSEAALDAYMADERRVALSALRERGIARTQVLRVEAW